MWAVLYVQPYDASERVRVLRWKVVSNAVPYWTVKRSEEVREHGGCKTNIVKTIETAAAAAFTARWGAEAFAWCEANNVPTEVVALFATVPATREGRDWSDDYSLVQEGGNIVKGGIDFLPRMYIKFTQSNSGTQRSNSSFDIFEADGVRYAWELHDEIAKKGGYYAPYYIHEKEIQYHLPLGHAGLRIEGQGHTTTSMKVSGTDLSVRCFGCSVSFFRWDTPCYGGGDTTNERAVVVPSDPSKVAYCIVEEDGVGPNGRSERYDVFEWNLAAGGWMRWQGTQSIEPTMLIHSVRGEDAAAIETKYGAVYASLIAALLADKGECWGFEEEVSEPEISAPTVEQRILSAIEGCVEAEKGCAKPLSECTEAELSDALVSAARVLYLRSNPAAEKWLADTLEWKLAASKPVSVEELKSGKELAEAAISLQAGSPIWFSLELDAFSWKVRFAELHMGRNKYSEQ